MSEEAHAHDAVHSDAHYIKIWGILLVLLVISIAGPEVAGNFDPSVGTWIVLITAFGIAFYKAYLVITHFMHLTVEKPIVGYMLITCLVFMVLFFAGVSPDVMKHTGAGWTNLSALEEVKRGEAAAAEGGHGEEHGAADATHAAEEAEEPAAEEEPAVTYASLKTDAEKKAFLMEKGEQVYSRGGASEPGAACVMCHSASGEGHPPNFPPLAGAAVKQWVGDCKTHAKIVLGGMEGEITIGEQTYNYPMPGFDGLTDEEVAAVTTYAANSWGNDFGICTPEDAASVR
jgi:caa(3)-type oxidase subunit IV